MALWRTLVQRLQKQDTPFARRPWPIFPAKTSARKIGSVGSSNTPPASRVLPENLEDLVLRLKSPNASALATPAVEVPAKVDPNLLKST